MNYQDYQTKVVQDMIARIEAGTAPWQKPWNSEVAAAQLLPYNPSTEKPYRGSNALVLLSEGLGDPRWCTYKQAQAQGWQVRRGSTSQTIVYWKFEETKKQRNPDTGNLEKVSVKLDPPRPFAAHVFNGTQIEGIPALEHVAARFEHHRAETLIKNSGAQIRHDQLDRAYYALTTDRIHLPPQAAFPDEPQYYATAFHELGHWTGHPDRLARDLGGGLGSEHYAKEELRAELASVLINGQLGIQHSEAHYEQHAAYLGSWLKALNDDQGLLFRAAREAQAAADYILAFEREQTPRVQAQPPREEAVVDYER